MAVAPLAAAALASPDQRPPRAASRREYLPDRRSRFLDESNAWPLGQATAVQRFEFACKGVRHRAIVVGDILEHVQCHPREFSVEVLAVDQDKMPPIGQALPVIAEHDADGAPGARGSVARHSSRRNHRIDKSSRARSPPVGVQLSQCPVPNRIGKIDQIRLAVAGAGPDVAEFARGSVPDEERGIRARIPAGPRAAELLPLVQGRWTFQPVGHFGEIR